MCGLNWEDVTVYFHSHETNPNYQFDLETNGNNHLQNYSFHSLRDHKFLYIRHYHPNNLWKSRISIKTLFDIFLSAVLLNNSK